MRTRTGIEIGAALALLLAGCRGDAPARAAAPDPGPISVNACRACRIEPEMPAVAHADVNEASGLAASAVHPGVVYVHNDSGDAARFFAIGAHGEDRGEYRLPGATSVDWEDAARGPCPEGSCLYFGDIGDNGGHRAFYVVHRVVEPAELAAGVHDVAYESFAFTYPDGSHDAETLLVHPRTGEVGVVTKADGGAALYVFPLPLVPGTRVRLERRAELAPVAQGMPELTGGDVSPTGHGILLRTYSDVWFYAARGPDEPMGATLSRRPCAAPGGLELQGEAIAWRIDGRGYVTMGEGGSPTLDSVSCGPTR